MLACLLLRPQHSQLVSEGACDVDFISGKLFHASSCRWHWCKNNKHRSDCPWSPCLFGGVTFQFFVWLFDVAHSHPPDVILYFEKYFGADKAIIYKYVSVNLVDCHSGWVCIDDCPTGPPPTTQSGRHPLWPRVSWMCRAMYCFHARPRLCPYTCHSFFVKGPLAPSLFYNSVLIMMQPDITDIRILYRPITNE